MWTHGAAQSPFLQLETSWPYAARSRAWYMISGACLLILTNRGMARLS